MTRYSQISLSRRAMVASALVVVAAIGLGLPTRADARIRVSVHVTTPDLQVRVNTPAPFRDPVLVRPLGRPYVVVDRHDRQIARSLARRFDCPRYVLLDLRRDGYTWTEIRAILSLPPHRLRAVLSAYDRPHEDHGRGNERGHGHGPGPARDAGGHRRHAPGED